MPEPTDAAAAPALDAPVQQADAPIATPATFDPSAYADHVVNVKVNGEDLSVPLKEALAGYQRQADYTQKTQTIAERASQLDYAEALASAYARDPAATIAYLAEQAGLDAPATGADPALPLDPEEQRWQRIEGFVSQQEQQQRDQEVLREMEAVKTQFGNVDEQALLRHAIQQNLPLMAAYKDMTFADVFAEAQAVRQTRAQQEAADQAALEAKRVAGGLIGGGHTTATGVVTPGSPGKMTPRQAFEAARQQLGL